MSPNGENKAGRFGRAFFSAKGRGVWLLAIVLTVAGALPSVVGRVSAQEDVKAIHNLRLESTQPGELVVTWDVPTETPVDYRLSWAPWRRELQDLDRPFGQCLPHDKFVYSYRLRRGCTLQGKGARPLPGNRRWPARRMERTGRGGRGGFADSDTDGD